MAYELAAKGTMKDLSPYVSGKYEAFDEGRNLGWMVRKVSWLNQKVLEM